MDVIHACADVAFNRSVFPTLLVLWFMFKMFWPWWPTSRWKQRRKLFQITCTLARLGVAFAPSPSRASSSALATLGLAPTPRASCSSLLLCLSAADLTLLPCVTACACV